MQYIFLYDRHFTGSIYLNKNRICEYLAAVWLCKSAFISISVSDTLCILKSNRKKQQDVIEEELTTYFRSIILFGKAKILQDDDEIYQAVNALGLKYCDDEIAVEKEIQREWKALCCVEIIIEHLTGKQAIELVK